LFGCLLLFFKKMPQLSQKYEGIRLFQFIREAEILWELSHPTELTVKPSGFGVPVIEMFGWLPPASVEGGFLSKPGLVMEHALCNLDAYAKDQGDAVMDSLSAICQQSLGGLVYIHSFPSAEGQIIHRDVKPQNILVCRVADDNLMLKYCDVGEARHVQVQVDPRGELTNTSGTALYQAPEVETGFYDTKVDVYSFGVMMCRFVSRYVVKLDERGLSTNSVVNRAAIIAEALKYLRESGYPDLASLLESCCAENPADRPTSSEALEIANRFIPVSSSHASVVTMRNNCF
jgi:serine/threonine protein kinase